MKIEQRFLLLTVTRLGDQLMAFPRPAELSILHDGAGEARLPESTCTFDTRFKAAVEAAWRHLRDLMPEETEGCSLELRIKARGELGGGSIGMPLVLAGLSALLSEPSPDLLQATGLMALGDGWFTGQLLQDMEAKAQALAPLAARHGREATLAIPSHRQIALPKAVEGVRYLPLAHTGQALDELFPDHSTRLREQLAALWTLDRLPFTDEIRSAFRSSGACAISLECTAYEPGPLTTRITEEPWGPTVWVDYPGLPGGGTMVYRFSGEHLTDKEHFADPEQARSLAGSLSESAEPIARRKP
jgi:hypothetical protein